MLTIPFFLSVYGIKNVTCLSVLWRGCCVSAVRFSDRRGQARSAGIVDDCVRLAAKGFFNISGSVFVEKYAKSRQRAGDVPRW
ncbi:hypothetical protein KCP73_16810 [Salmonella enterica subsp. enterica]|nr:hypothetical protein KCP73_16810 [Salmonella enterica subsp. enterica]